MPERSLCLILGNPSSGPTHTDEVLSSTLDFCHYNTQKELIPQEAMLYKYYNTNLGILSKEIAIFGKCTIFFVIFTRIRTVELAAADEKWYPVAAVICRVFE